MARAPIIPSCCARPHRMIRWGLSVSHPPCRPPGRPPSHPSHTACGTDGGSLRRRWKAWKGGARRSRPGEGRALPRLPTPPTPPAGLTAGPSGGGGRRGKAGRAGLGRARGGRCRPSLALPRARRSRPGEGRALPPLPRAPSQPRAGRPDRPGSGVPADARRLPGAHARGPCSRRAWPLRAGRVKARHAASPQIASRGSAIGGDGAASCVGGSAKRP